MDARLNLIILKSLVMLQDGWEELNIPTIDMVTHVIIMNER